MKTQAASLFAFLLVSVCAAEPKISGHKPTEFGRSADRIWQEQLAHGKGGRENHAVFRAVRGDFAILENDSKRVTAKVGAVVHENSLIKTGNGSQVDIFLGDNGPVLRVLENSTLKFVRLRARKISKTESVVDTMIELEDGRLLGNVKKLAAESSYLIRTPRSVLRIRGTEFSVDATGRVDIVHGAAELVSDSKSRLLNAGESFSPERGIQKARAIR